VSVEFPFRRPAIIVLLWLMVFAFGIALLLAGAESIDDWRGATVDAPVVSITTNVPGRRVYAVQLPNCVTTVDSGSNPAPREIRVGGLSRVHYRASDPCAPDAVRESTSSAPWPFALTAAAAVAAALFSLRQLRRKR
jgi:hypothetical protein